MDRCACDADFCRDLLRGQAFLIQRDHIQRDHLVVPRRVPGAARLSALLVGWRPFGGTPRRVRWSQCTRRLAQANVLAGEGALHGLPSMQQKMKAVSDLLGLGRAGRAGRAGRGGSGVVTAAGATDEADRGMVLEPVRKGVLRAVGQEVNHASLFQIHEQRARAARPSAGEIIHSQDRHWR